MSNTTKRKVERTSATREGREESVRDEVRTPVRDQRKDILHVFGKKDPNRVYRIVNDDDKGRVQMLQNAGWRIEKSKDFSIGRANPLAADGEGGLCKVHTRTTLADGTPMFAYYMSIDKEWYNEDRAAYEAETDAIEAQMKKPSTQGLDYGTIKSATKSYL